MKLKTVLRLEQQQLKQHMARYLADIGYKDVVVAEGYLYAKGSHPVLLTAHLDTVHHDECKDICASGNGRILMSPQGIGGDDRCGVYMIAQIAKSIQCSVLLCEDEERGCVGSHIFERTGTMLDDINYIVGLDRHGGNDAVFYDCDNKEFTDFVTSNTHFKEEFGTYSDISVLGPYAEIAAVNFSCGYYNEHTTGEYIDTVVMHKNIENIKKMLRVPSKKFEYVERVYANKYGNDYCYGWYGEGTEVSPYLPTKYRLKLPEVESVARSPYTYCDECGEVLVGKDAGHYLPEYGAHVCEFCFADYQEDCKKGLA